MCENDISHRRSTVLMVMSARDESIFYSRGGRLTWKWKWHCFRPLFCTERLNWAGDTPGRIKRSLDETCPRGRIELTSALQPSALPLTYGGPQKNGLAQYLFAYYNPVLPPVHLNAVPNSYRGTCLKRVHEKVNSAVNLPIRVLGSGILV
jgi:hypothetical protein